MKDFIEAYRPDRFENVIGNDHIKSKMKAWISRGFRPRSILLTGDYGTGKTTLAELMSKRFVCFSEARENIESCEECSACKRPGFYIRKYDMPNTSVDLVRDLLCFHRTHLFTQAPVIYFDELQRWTKRNQEIFLIPIDEMTDTLFIFSTTNPSEIEDGILSRSTILHVETPSADELVQRMGVIAKDTSINITEGALKRVVKLARKIPRICIKAMNHLMCIEGEITEDTLDREEIRRAIMRETTV